MRILVIGWLAGCFVSSRLLRFAGLAFSLHDALPIVMKARLLKASASSSANLSCLIHSGSCSFKFRFSLCKTAGWPIFAVDCTCPSGWFVVGELESSPSLAPFYRAKFLISGTIFFLHNISSKQQYYFSMVPSRVTKICSGSIFLLPRSHFTSN